MLKEQDFVEIGQLRRAFGYQGQIKISVEDMYERDLYEQKFLFIGIDGYKVPFEIENINEAKGINIKLRLLDTPEDISRYHNSPIYLLKEKLVHAKSFIDENELMTSLAGLALYDIELGYIGVIDRVEEYPQQIMAIVIKNESEVLIPLHSSLIESIDEEAKKLIMNLPEGLI
jgi:16S rRNA processing protein RimM